MWLGCGECRGCGCVCLRAPRAGLADRGGALGAFTVGSPLCQGSIRLSPKQSVSVLRPAVPCPFSGLCPPPRGARSLQDQGHISPSLVLAYARYPETEASGPQPASRPCFVLVPGPNPAGQTSPRHTPVLTPRPQGWPRSSHSPERIWTRLGLVGRDALYHQTWGQNSTK